MTYRFHIYASALVSLCVGTTSCSDNDPVASSQDSCDQAGGGSSGAEGVGGTAATGGAPARETFRLRGSSHYECDEPAGQLPELEFASIADGFERPVLVTHAPDDPLRLFVVERAGVIRLLTRTEADAKYSTVALPFLDLSARVATEVDQALLGLAFHPDYATNGLFYVHYCASADVADAKVGDVLVEEYHVAPDANVADVGSARRVLHVPYETSIHQGGTLAFGSDDQLYISLGDGGPADDGQGNGQKVTDLNGGILRINPLAKGGLPYTIPTGNLRESRLDAAPEVWDFGLRNPYRMNFDACTGDLYIGDVGQREAEEIDIELPRSGHRNYGWPIMEGLDCHRLTPDCDKTGLILPVAAVEHHKNAFSIVGGTVYRGHQIPALRGTYLYGLTQSGSVFTLRFDGATVSEPVDITAQVNPPTDQVEVLTSIQNGGDGEIYATGYISGRVLELRAR